MKILSEVRFIGLKASALTERRVTSILSELDALCGRLLSARVEILASEGHAVGITLRLAFADAVTHLTTPLTRGLHGVPSALDEAITRSLRSYIDARLHDTPATHALAA